MAGYRVPSAGMSDAAEEIDGGTLARISTPRPGTLSGPRGTTAAMATPAPDAPWSGGVPAALGLPSVVRIPVPGTTGLCIEFTPRGWNPSGGSTSTLFFQDPTGKRHLRLDYGYNVKTKSVDYHWNQSGTHADFGVTDHTPAGRAGAIAYQGAKYFRYAGRVLLVVGIATDVVSIVVADRPLRRGSQVAAGWAAAWLGCRLVGAGGAALGTLASPLGSAVGGVTGCIVGGFVGYQGASIAAADVYDWAEGTRFTPLPQVTLP